MEGKERNKKGQFEAAKPGARGLSKMQEEFCQLVSAGVKKKTAAERVGYVVPATAAYQLLRNPKIIARIDEIHASEGTELVGVALKTLGDLMKADRPDRTRLDAAKAVLHHDRARQDRNAKALKTHDKPLSEYSPDELDSFIGSAQERIDKLRDITQNNAKTIDGKAESTDETSA